MAEKPDPNDPSNVSSEWAEMAPKWKLIQTLLDGTDAMRAAGQDYLPQHDAESPGAYAERLGTNTLYNVFKLTVNALVGRPFQTEIKWSEDTPEQIAALFSNIDLQGSDLNAFCREWFRGGLSKGFYHILVDFNGPQPSERATRTKADDMKANVRPYWKLICPENVIAAYATVVDGVEQLTHVRIRECETVRVGFLEEEREYIRVLEPGRWWRYEQIKDPKTGKSKWVVESEGVTDVPFIPLVTFYAARDEFMCCTPPLLDLAYLNVRHWQSTSDQISVLTVARFPMLAVAGIHDTKAAELIVGPRQLLSTRDAAGRFYYVEHSGKSIEAGANELANLEELMGNYGAEFLKKKKAASRNPQDRIYDVTEATSELQEMILRFCSSVYVALQMTAAWLKLPEKDGALYGGTVMLDNDFTIQDSNANDLQHLAQARKNGDISLETYIDTLKRLNVIDDSVVTQEEIDRIVKERIETMEREAKAEGMKAKAKADAAPKPATVAPGQKPDDQPPKGPTGE